MKVINTGKFDINFITNSKPITLKPNDTTDIDERTFVVLNKLFPALVIVEEKVETVIEAEPQPIETKPKAKKNGSNKKSK